ncbi:pyrethroid hydrolase Ces2a-like [Panulirus ornatus]|uniref:pyrethroid hydrolase Ces2a-like n=1 Tax=Panulirus ornatus TaxID=150431 RepID=UPI003A84F814
MNVVAALVLVVVAVMAVADEAPVANTLQGRVAGVKEESTKGRTFYSYHRIPFAKPPVGELRLKDPVAGERWEGVLDGSTMPEPCLQIPFGISVIGLPDVHVGREDCLYLNVFTPESAEEGSNLPVMVWIHGGGFFAGSTNEYLPHVLLNHDVVIVSIQYRLGIMGFLSTEDSVIPGNFGLKDQTLALQWVQRNIHNFGGDKTRVTIFGESAGGASVHYHILSPKSEGLFSRAIMQSGSSLCPWAFTWSAAPVKDRVAEAFGCSTSEGSEALLTCLQSLDAIQLALYASELNDWFLFPIRLAPRMDGDYLPEEPSQLVRKGRHQHVDIMTGVTANEGGLFTMPMYVRRELLDVFETNFSLVGPASLQCHEDDHPTDVATQIYRRYLGELKFDETRSEDVLKAFSARHFFAGVDWAAMYHARNQHPNKKVYTYELQHTGEMSLSDFFEKKDDKKWVVHGDDLFYLFWGGPIFDSKSTPKPLRDLQQEEDLALRDIMTTLWTNFAETGNPTPDDSLGFTWEPSTEDNLQYLALKLNPTMEADQRQEMRRFHASLPTKENFILHPDLVKAEPGGGREEL